MENNREVRPSMKISGIVLDCADAAALADFYHSLLGWDKTYSGGGWAGLTSPEGVVLAFQEVEGYIAPVWPWEAGKPGQMVHFDLLVDDLEEAVRFAVSCGARIADTQFFKSSCTLFDPAGHPFCLDTHEPELPEKG